MTICNACQAENEEQAESCARCGDSLEPTAVTPRPPAAPASYVVAVDLRPGAIFHGRYEIETLLGRGGMGMVYRARDRVLDEVVAIKILRPDFAADPKMADRFRSEIKLARRVRHRNVCAIHDYGEDHGLLFISMEHVEGVDLKRKLRDRGGLEPAEAYDIAIQVAEGLQAVHEAGIVHRDLKTPNIMVDAQGTARLLDFGVAKRLGEGTVTATGHIFGTPEYMSPEQGRGEKVDARSDLYALGVLTYEVFTGRVPFHGDTPISTILKHLHDPPPLEGAVAAGIPPALRPVLRRALAKEAKDRYQSARDMAEALRGARSPSSRQQPIATDVLQAPSLPARDRRPRGPRPRWRATQLAPWLLALPVALGAVALWRLRAAPVTLSAPASSPAAPAAGAPSPPPPLAGTVAPSVPAATSEAPAPPPMSRAVAVRPPSMPTAATAAPRASPPAAARPEPRPTTSAGTAAAAAVSPPVSTPPVVTAPSAPGLLQIAVRPWGEVSVDGKVVGTTPLDRLTLPPGPHTVRVRHPSYEIVERTVTIRSGQLEKVVIDLDRSGSKRQ